MSGGPGPGDRPDRLDAEQRLAVQHGGGPFLVVAGAGSGKTRAIVARIVRLVRDGVPPGRIVGITFTNRAAGEMRDRVERELPRGGELPWLGTFHSFGALLLRRFGARIGVPPHFLIYDGRDQIDAIRQALRELDLDEKRHPPERFAGLIERAKRDGCSVETAAIRSGWAFVGKAEAVAQAYAKGLAAAGAVDFADLIRRPVELLRSCPEVLEAVRGEIRHLLVDEFQDVDAAQAELARMIGAGAESFCAVGDEDQSIYGWRGASAGPMMSFERDFPGASVLHLRTNYRTRASILAAAGSLIRNNRTRREKDTVAARDGGERPVIRAHDDADDEARGVAAAAAAEIRRGTKPKEIAVFYRVNAQSRALEDAFRADGIPYVLRGALSFYDRASVRDAVAYLRWFLHPDDPVSLKRMLKSPRRGVGDATLSRARDEANRSGAPLSAALARIPALGPLFSLRESWLAGLPGRRVGETLRRLLEGAGFLSWIDGRAGGDPGDDRGSREDDRENVQELLRLADSFPGTGEEAAREFLERMSLAPEKAEGEERLAVRLMTFHNAKGLEFESVFLTGLEDGLLPHSRSADSDDGVEEERRLFYVGLTRARERALLSYARRRALFGAFRETTPSRFLFDLPRSLVRWEGDGHDAAAGPARPAAAGGLRRARAAGPTVRRPGNGGDRGPVTPDGGARPPRAVRHPVFGTGRVEAVEGTGVEEKITAVFPGYGRKKILRRAVAMELMD